MIEKLNEESLFEYMDDLKELYGLLSKRPLRYQDLLAATTECYLYGIFNEDELVGVASLYCNHGPWGIFGRIENVAIKEDYQKKGYGKLLVEHLVNLAFLSDAYKVDLMCGDDKVPFYTKCGFEKVSNGMKKYNEYLS